VQGNANTETEAEHCSENIQKTTIFVNDFQMAFQDGIEKPALSLF
jgi:hypothetical protein